jgi:hypothetical protein
MRWNLKFKSMVFFLMMFGLLLLMAGCGSDSNSDNPAPPTGPVDASLSDFIGTWGMWEQRGYTDLSCGGPDSAAEEIEYNIRIEQNGGQVQLYLFDDDNQSISCQLDDNELACQGAYDWGDGWSITYDEYRIYFIGVGHTELKGEVTWTISNNGSECHGTSGLCTTCSTGHPSDGHPGGGGPVDTGVEICTNNSDDDGDSNIDCDDSDCATDPACTGGGSGDAGEDTYADGCANDSDDDGDGDVDCEDADCAGDPACNGGGGLVCAPEVCSPVCPSGNCSTCVTSGNCNSTCIGGNCDQQCGGNNTQCNLTCTRGNCDMSCQDSAHCNMACPGGNCQMTCTGDADCNMTCSGGNCDVTCDTTGTCITPP